MREIKFEIGKWYNTSDGYNVEFIRTIEEDGMYNVFRHDKENEYRPYYTDRQGKTAYGTAVLELLSKVGA